MSAKIDEIDRGILRFLQRDARMAFTEIAHRLEVSSGTIHQRVRRMEDAGILLGTTTVINPIALGYTVITLIGVHLRSAQSHSKVIAQLKEWPEVLEVNYTTGTYGLIVKVVTKDIPALHQFLVNKLQTLEQVQATESFISLDQPVSRGITMDPST